MRITPSRSCFTSSCSCSGPRPSCPDSRSGSRCSSAPVTALLGGYDTARFVHFLAMAGIVGFIGIHLILVVLVPRTLLSMISGATLARGHAHETEART